MTPEPHPVQPLIQNLLPCSMMVMLLPHLVHDTAAASHPVLSWSVVNVDQILLLGPVT